MSKSVLADFKARVNEDSGFAMRNWDAPSEAEFLGRVVAVLKEGGLLAPGRLDSSAILDLRGLKFPTLKPSNLAVHPVTAVDRRLGHLEFEFATVRDVDFTKANLSCSTWNCCSFERVCFNKAVLNQVRFLGCRLLNCSFQSTDLRNASFSVGDNGEDTIVTASLFERSDFRGGSCDNPVLRSTSFVNCKLDGFVFNGAKCDDVCFAGRYKELTFRGIPGDVNRNQLHIDLSKATIKWLNADYGIDLSQVILPTDDSCLVIKDRLRFVEQLSSLLSKEAGQPGKLVANVLSGLYSSSGISPLDPSQDMFLLSKAMITDFSDEKSNDNVDSLFRLIESIAQSQGVLTTRH